MSKNSLFFSLATRAAPLLMATQQGDSDDIFCHLRLFSTDFITQCSSPDDIFTPYFSSLKNQKELGVKGKNTTTSEDWNAEVVDTLPVFPQLSFAQKKIDCVYPIGTAMAFFPEGEDELCRRKHVFELNIFLALLRHPREDYASVVFWSFLIEKLEDLDFFTLMYTNIAQLWELIKQQQRDAFGLGAALHLLQLSCDTLLLFSEHALRAKVGNNTSRGLALLVQEMWAADALLAARRCAVVISVLLSKCPFLVLPDVLFAERPNLDTPLFLVVLAAVPQLSASTDEKDVERLRAAMEIVFITEVYSIPILMYFCDHGVFSVVLHHVRQRFAVILYELFAEVSSEFWCHFSDRSLLSAAEAIATYSYLWTLFPSGTLSLLRVAHNGFKERSDVYSVSLFNYCTAASVYHLSLAELEDVSAFFEMGGVHCTEKSNLVIEGEKKSDNSVARLHVVENFSMATEMASLLKKAFSFLTGGWMSSGAGDNVLVRSALYLLYSMLWNYNDGDKELDRLVGCNLQSLFQQVSVSLLAANIDDVAIAETLYGTIARFHGLLGNIGFAASNLLIDKVMEGVGVRHNTTEIALLQLRLYGTLFEAYENALPFNKILVSITHIHPGVIATSSSLTMPFFLQWFSVVQMVLSSRTFSSVALSSFFEGFQDKVIHRLCEGVFLLSRELQLGNVFLGAYPTIRFLEGVIRLLSIAVVDGGHYDTLATCVIATHNEKTLSACFMLYCLVFAFNASLFLVESTAGLLANVLENSHEKLFTTMRFHTSVQRKRRFLSFVHKQLRPSKRLSSCYYSSSVNVIRLESLCYLFCLDPASFYYIVVPDEAESDGFTELPLICILRDTVRSLEVTALEKAGALELLGALEDVNISIADATSLLENTKCEVEYIKSAFTAAVANYVCRAVICETRATGNQNSRLSEGKGQQRNSHGRAASGVCRGRTVLTHSSAFHSVLSVGYEALKKCSISYKKMESELWNKKENNSASHLNQKQHSRSVSLRETRGSQLAFFSNKSASVTSSRQHDSALFFQYACNAHMKLKPLLLGDEFFLLYGENALLLNQMASTLESVTRLTSSLEAVLWVMSEEKEALTVAVTLLEIALKEGVCMVEQDVLPLRRFSWTCLYSWLTLARAATFVISPSFSGSVLSLQTTTLSPLFQNVLKLIVFSNENIDIASCCLSVLTAFQPHNAHDSATAIRIFELIASVLEKHKSTDFSSTFVTFLSECATMFSLFGGFCPITSAVNILDKLWIFGTYVSHMISATGSSNALCDVFDHIFNTINAVLLHCDGLLAYFTHKRVIELATVLGQFSDAVFYEGLSNIYRPQAWHCAWMSVLRLLQTVLVRCENEVSSQAGEWLTAISALVTTSPRFKEAVSGFTIFNSQHDRLKPFIWELLEMQLCTTIVALLASFGVFTSSLVPHVRRCFCQVRRYSIKTMTVVDSQIIKSILLATVRYQLTYFFFQPLPPPAAVHAFNDERVIVTVGSSGVHTHKSFSSSTVGHLQKRMGEGEIVIKEDEQLSFELLRFFIFRGLKFIRKSNLDNPSAVNTSFSSENTPLQNSSFTTVNSVETPSEADFRESHNRNTAPHIENVQLALVLFVRYAKFHLGARSLTFFERQELGASLEKLLHALGSLIYEVRCLDNLKLTSVVECVRDELQELFDMSQSG